MENKTIKLGCFGIEILFIEKSGNKSCSIISNLHDVSLDEEKPTVEYTASMHAIESIILAHAMAGIDVSTPAYIEGIETAVEKCANYFSDN